MKFVLDNGIMCDTIEQAVNVLYRERKLKGSKIQRYKDVLLPVYHKHYMEARKRMSLHKRGMDKRQRYSAMAVLWASISETYSVLSEEITAYRKLRTELNALGREIRKYEEIMESSAVRGRQI